jgi:pyruvate/2-oxoglutarate dehydrogenase complex dihydrolipoamide acyltransferase (E2) component
MTMLTTVIVPKSGGVTSTKAVVVRWLKREGDRVQAGDPLVELETEKISYELESPAAGTLINILAHEAAEVPVGEPLCHIGEKKDSLPGPRKSGSGKFRSRDEKEKRNRERPAGLDVRADGSHP